MPPPARRVGFAFGLGGLGAALLDVLAERTSIDTVYRLCVFLPLLGIAAALLPNSRDHQPEAAISAKGQ